MGLPARWGKEGSGEVTPPDPLPYSNRTGARVALLRSPVLQPVHSSCPSNVGRSRGCCASASPKTAGSTKAKNSGGAGGPSN